MKNNRKRIIGIMLMLLLTFPLVGAGKADGNVKLDLDDYHEKNTATTVSSGKSVSIAEGNITYTIPDSMEKIDAEGIFNEHIYSTKNDNFDGGIYLEGDSLLGVFYFDSDYFVKEADEKGEIRAIERAIISNICPQEKSILNWKSLTLKHFLFPTSESTSRAGLKFDNYVAHYNNFRVEFAFTPAKNGLCVIMFIYNHDATPADSAISVMESLKVMR